MARLDLLISVSDCTLSFVCAPGGHDARARRQRDHSVSGDGPSLQGWALRVLNQRMPELAIISVDSLCLWEFPRGCAYTLSHEAAAYT